MVRFASIDDEAFQCTSPRWAIEADLRRKARVSQEASSAGSNANIAVEVPLQTFGGELAEFAAALGAYEELLGRDESGHVAEGSSEEGAVSSVAAFASRMKLRLQGSLDRYVGQRSSAFTPSGANNRAGARVR